MNEYSVMHDRVRSFSRALALALYDRKLELAGKKILYFYDTDVVLNMVMGFEWDLGRPHRSTPTQRLVRSLLASNILGQINILRPHALELSEKLSQQPRYLRASERELLGSRARQYLREKGISKVMEELHDVAKERNAYSGIPYSQRAERFFQILRSCAGDAFASIEQINGTWAQRLRRYFDKGTLTLERLGPEVTEILEDAEDVVHGISRVLREARPKHSLNAFRDALALSVLARQVADWNSGSNVDIVRFYTETSSIHEASAQNAILKNWLSYDRPILEGESIDGEEAFIFRDGSYFIMRAWFSELAPSSGDEISGESLKNLEELSHKLSDLQEAKAANIEKALAAEEHDGRRLLDLVDDYERLTIVGSVWIKGRVPVEVIDQFENWTDVFAFAKGEVVESRLFEEIGDIEEHLGNEVKRVKRWTQDFEVILDASNSVRTEGLGKIEEPLRDLGLVRWGYELTYEEVSELVGILRLLFLEDELDLTVEASKLASQMEQARRDVRQCLIMCAVLWALGQFREITKLVVACTEAVKTLPPTLSVIQSAAILKDRIASRQKRTVLVNQVLQLLESVDDDRRVGILLGVGYILYHAWKQETLASGILHPSNEQLSAEVQLWAYKSFQVGSEAFDKLEKGELAWAFAINHCAYVGIVADIEHDRTENFYRALLRLQNIPGIWNNRFDDTIGCYYLFGMERIWSRSNDEQRRGLEWAEDFRRAEEYFNRAKLRDSGDIDIREHIARLDSLRREYSRIKMEDNLSL